MRAEGELVNTIFDITDDDRALDVAMNYGLTRYSTYSLQNVTVSLIDVPAFGDIEDEEAAEWIAQLIADGHESMPSVVLVGDEVDGYAVVDGHHRSVALRSLGVTTVQAWVAD